MKKDCARFKKWLEIKVIQSCVFVMNVIWLLLIITRGGLILGL